MAWVRLFEGFLRAFEGGNGTSRNSMRTTLLGAQRWRGQK
jgi:hypothetical protein